MQQVTSEFGPGTIITAAAAQPRFFEFTISVDDLLVPLGTKHIIERSCDVPQNYNTGLRKMIGEWAWFLGDDHAFAPTLLMRFLQHHVDVVVPIAPCKVAPWMPCVMHGPTPEMETIWHPDMLLYDWDELSGTGLMPLPLGDFIGQAGMLVKKRVLDAIGDPWFKAGQLDPGRMQEDMMFCHEIQKHGFTIYVDRDVIFDHYILMGVTARRHNGMWVPALRSGKHVMVLPDAKPVFNANTEAPVGKVPLRWKRLPQMLPAEVDGG